MKHIIILSIACLVLAGCASNNPPQQTKIAEPAAFPEYLVGVWVANNANDEPIWGFKFEPDGKIKKMRHIVTDYVTVNDDPIYLEGKEEGSYATFIFEPIHVDYNPQSQELAVSVILEHYFMKFQAGVIEGRTEDYFGGKVNEGDLTWNAEWINYGWLEGATPPDINSILPEPLTFRKILDKDLEEVKKK